MTAKIIDIRNNVLNLDNINDERILKLQMTQPGKSDIIFVDTTDLHAQTKVVPTVSPLVVRFLSSLNGINFVNLDAGNRIFNLTNTDENNGNEKFIFLGKIRFIQLEWISGSGSLDLEIFV